MSARSRNRKILIFGALSLLSLALATVFGLRAHRASPAAVASPYSGEAAREARQSSLRTRGDAPSNLPSKESRGGAHSLKSPAALPRFDMGQQLPVRVCFAAANFSYLCFG